MEACASASADERRRVQQTAFFCAKELAQKTQDEKKATKRLSRPTASRLRLRALPAVLALGALSAVLLELPLAVVERTHLARLEPPRDAVEVERVVCQNSRCVSLL